MTKWEYKTTVHKMDKLEEALNVLGADGWEAFMVETSGHGYDIMYSVWWKRGTETLHISTLLTD